MTLLAEEFNALTGRLQTTEEVRRRFVSDASHELKTPLASIRLLTDSILQAEHMDEQTAREFLADIGRRPSAHPHYGKAAHPHPGGYRAPRRGRAGGSGCGGGEGGAHAHPLAGAVPVELRLFLDPDCRVLATWDDLYQVVFNLMENAVKYNRPGGLVLVTLAVRGGQVILRVEDTGVASRRRTCPRSSTGSTGGQGPLPGRRGHRAGAVHCAGTPPGSTGAAVSASRRAEEAPALRWSFPAGPREEGSRSEATTGRGCCWAL